MPNIWSPKFSGCNVLDYHVWGAVERKTNKTLFITKDELKAKITATLTNLMTETIEKACRRFQSLPEAMAEANGDFFE